MFKNNLKATLLIAAGLLIGCGSQDVTTNSKEGMAPSSTGKLGNTSASGVRMNKSGDEITINPIFFNLDSAMINSEATKMLEVLAMDLTDNPDIEKIIIEGHADQVGPEPYNYKLGMRRAIAVKNFLVFQGVSEERIATISFGEQRPRIDMNEDEPVRENRRVMIVIPKKDQRLTALK